MTNLTKREDTLRDALADMCWQFAYPGTKDGKRILGTGGLSALEGAFAILGWDDPHYAEGSTGCSAPDCAEWSTGGHPHETGYYHTCSKHGNWSPS